MADNVEDAQSAAAVVAASHPNDLNEMDEEEEENKAESPAEQDAAVATNNNTGAGVAQAAAAALDDEKKKEDAAEAAKKEAEDKDTRDYSDWPYKNIKEPHDNDVLYGRGGGTNHHPGNKRYRRMVEDKKIEYVNCKRLDKPLVALSIIKIWRGQKPPGRFLKMDDKTGLWNDVGDKKAREKTSQALREKAPEIRKELEREKRIQNGEDVSDEAEEEDVVEGSRPGIVARDHSLGRDYVSNNEGVSLGNFHWAEGVREGSDTFLQSPPPQMPYQQYPDSRTNSNTSFVRPDMPHPGVFPEHMSSMDHVQLMFAEQHNQQQMQQRYESAGSVPPLPSYCYPPVHTTSGGSVPPVPCFYPPLHATSNGSVPPPPPPPVPGYNNNNNYSSMVHTTSWSTVAMPREHSLSQNQLPHATCNQAAYPTAFDATRTPSGQWRPPLMPMTYHYTPPGGHTPYQHQAVPPTTPAPPPSGNNGIVYTQPQHHQQQSPQPQPPHQQQSHQQQNPYAVDPAVASQWSSQSYPGVPSLPPLQHQHPQPSMSQSSQGAPPPPVHNLPCDHYPPNPYLQQQQASGNNNAPKPEIVKRATSHQNETAENRHGFDGQSVKRAFMSRDGSNASSRLRQDYQQAPAASSEYATAAAPPPPARPSALTLEERMSTLDLAAAASSAQSGNTSSATSRPRALTASNRLSTIDALTLNFDDPDRGLEDLFDHPAENEQQHRSQQPKPSALRSEFRVTTMDLIDIVNEPLPFAEV